MALIVNGTEISNKHDIIYNGTSLTKIIYNDTTVWEKLVYKTKYMNIYISIFGTITEDSYTINKISIDLGAAAPARIYFNFNSSINGGNRYNVQTTLIEAGKSTYDIEPKKTYSLGKTDVIRFYGLAYTYIEGEDVTSDRGSVLLGAFSPQWPTTSNSYESMAGTIYYQ